MEFKDSKTFANLQNALAAELMTTTKFLIYALQARQEGFIQIGNVFDQIARNERELATIWMKQLNDGSVPDTAANLVDSYTTANYLGTQMYQEYSRVATEEGYTPIASLFNGVANIQFNHETRFRSLSTDMVNNQVFCKDTQSLWICLACGNILSGDCAPEICPICGYPQGYYQIYVENCP